jgi:integrase
MGRRGHAWFRSSRNCYSTKIGGKMFDLDVAGPPSAAKQRAADEARSRLVAELAATVASVVRAEIAPPASTGASCQPGTVAELVPRYLDAADVREPTRADYGWRLRWLAGGFGGVPVGELDAAAVSAAARGQGWAANTRRQTLTVCQQFVRWCGRGDFALSMPAMESRGDEAVVTRDEHLSLLAVARGDFRPYLRFLWLTGCRPGEACSLTCDQVDWASGTATLKDHKTKRRGKRRTLFLSDEALAVLAVQRAKYGSGPLFRGKKKGKALRPDNVTERFARAVAAAGLRETLVCYGYRHAYATRMLESGVPPSDVAALLGHSGTAVLERTYSHITANARRLRDVAGRLDGAA